MVQSLYPSWTSSIHRRAAWWCMHQHLWGPWSPLQQGFLQMRKLWHQQEAMMLSSHRFEGPLTYRLALRSRKTCEEYGATRNVQILLKQWATHLTLPLSTPSFVVVRLPSMPWNVTSLALVWLKLNHSGYETIRILPPIEKPVDVKVHHPSMNVRWKPFPHAGKSLAVRQVLHRFNKLGRKWILTPPVSCCAGLLQPMITIFFASISANHAPNKVPLHTAVSDWRFDVGFLVHLSDASFTPASLTARFVGIHIPAGCSRYWSHPRISAIARLRFSNKYSQDKWRRKPLGYVGLRITTHIHLKCRRNCIAQPVVVGWRGKRSERGTAAMLKVDFVRGYRTSALLNRQFCL